jgi:putative transcriptional regulator
MKNDSRFENFDFGKVLAHSLKQAVDFENGEKARARITVCGIETPIYKGADVRRIRDNLRLSQNGMALALGVSKRTVEAWEAGKNNPSHTTNKLLYLIEQKRELLDLLILPKTN